MTKKIQQLSSAVVKKLRSDIAFINVAHCVEELVLNSIDAGANCIAVHLNLPYYRIQVIDNGCGIDMKQMKMIGVRYATSKCHTLEDLQYLKSGGFRGEALSSLKGISSVLMIESRAASSNETYCKIFTQGKSSDPKKSLNSRPSKGTTVSVYDFMYNMPVRKNSISETLDLEECRKLLQGIALMYPNISFTLKNEATGEMSLQLKKCTSLYRAFLQMFGKSKASNLKNIDYQRDEYEINGCINTDCHISKDLQFLYVNRRRVLRTKLHKLINSILNKALSSKQKSNLNINNLTPDGSSPSKNQCMCIFALNISCPYDKYDIIFEPRKTMIEFSDWQVVLKIVEDSLLDFLKRENLYLNCDESAESMLNANLETNNNQSSFNIQDCKQGLFSNAAHRLHLASDASKNNAAHENMDSLTQNLEEENTIVSNAFISSKPKEFVPNYNKNTNTSTEGFSSIKYVKLFDKVSCIYSDSDASNISVFNCVKSINAKASCKDLENCTSNSQEIESSIPCRSVFPSESPIMLRVPVNSTLSDLQTSTSNSNFLKLKEKFNYLPTRQKIYTLNSSKYDKKHSKVGLKSNIASRTLSFNKSSLQRHLQPSFNKEKPETKECNQQNSNHKSSQFPSVSFEKVQEETCNNIYNTEGKEMCLKAIEDKYLQCLPVSSEKKAKIVSRFRFEKEPTNLPIQCLRKPTSLKRKSSKEICSKDDVATVDDLISHINTNNDMSNAKKLRSSLSVLSANAVSNINNTIEKIDNNDMDIENLPDVRVNSEVKFSSNFDSAFEIDVLSENTSVSSVPEACIISKTRESKFSNLNQLEYSTFNLQTFNKVKDIKHVQSVHVLTGLDVSHMFEKAKLQSYNVDTCTSVNELNDFQNFSSHNISVEVISDLKSLTDINSDYNFKHSSDALMTESMHLEKPKENNIVDDRYLKLEILKEGSTDENMLRTYSKVVSPYLDNMKNDSYNANTSNDSGLFNSQSKNSSENDKIPIDIQIESLPVISLQNKNEHNVEGSALLANHVGMQYSRNSTLSNEISFNSINFESNPFTEHLPSVTEDCSLKQKDLQENNNESISTCISQDLSIELPTIESLNMDVESFDNNQKSNIEVFASNLENKEQNQSEGIDEKENSANTDSACSDMNDKNLLICTSNDKIGDIENKKEDLCDKKSPNYHNRWKLHSEPESKRKIFIDSITGNSSYVVPERQEIQVDQNMETNGNNDVKNMLKEWDNPMFDIPYEVTSVTGNKISQNVPQMCAFLNSYKFSKTTLSTLQVVGQVDCKFIACILQDFNENCKDQRLLALFDQHAVHERIRLEELIEDLYDADQNGEKIVKTSTICQPLEVTFDDEEIRLLHTYHEKLHRIGIHLNINKECNVCHVYSVPVCLVHKETQELRRSVFNSIVILQNSVKEWLTSLMKTRSIPQVLPKALLSVLNYQACRGAVKFGDPLSLKQCRDLLKSLSGCKLPFQCAHGRPSVAPILDLKKIEALYRKRPPPQLQTIHTHFQ